MMIKAYHSNELHDNSVFGLQVICKSPMELLFLNVIGNTLIASWLTYDQLDELLVVMINPDVQHVIYICKKTATQKVEDDGFVFAAKRYGYQVTVIPVRTICKDDQFINDITRTAYEVLFNQYWCSSVVVVLSRSWALTTKEVECQYGRFLNYMDDTEWHETVA